MTALVARLIARRAGGIGGCGCRRRVATRRSLKTLCCTTPSFFHDHRDTMCTMKRQENLTYIIDLPPTITSHYPQNGLQRRFFRTTTTTRRSSVAEEAEEAQHRGEGGGGGEDVIFSNPHASRFRLLGVFSVFQAYTSLAFATYIAYFADLGGQVQVPEKVILCISIVLPATLISAGVSYVNGRIVKSLTTIEPGDLHNSPYDDTNGNKKGGKKKKRNFNRRRNKNKSKEEGEGGASLLRIETIGTMHPTSVMVAAEDAILTAPSKPGEAFRVLKVEDDANHRVAGGGGGGGRGEGEGEGRGEEHRGDRRRRRRIFYLDAGGLPLHATMSYGPVQSVLSRPPM